jgi:hypothetical protein
LRIGWLGAQGWRNETLCRAVNGKYGAKVPHDIEEKDATSGGMRDGLLEFDYVSLMPLHRCLNIEPMALPIFRL